MKNRFNMLYVIAIVFFMMFFVPVLEAKNSNDIVLGKKITIYSKVLNEDRELLIYPANALENNAPKRLVMYLLDGDAHFAHIAGLVSYMRQIRLVPDNADSCFT